MPIYEYRCEACNEKFEALRRLGQGADGLTCPRCGKDRVEKEYSTFASAGPSGGGCASGGRFT